MSQTLLSKESLLQKKQELENEQQSLKMEESTIDRELKGITLFENGHVTIIDDDASKVLSSDGKQEYLVNHTKGTCQCKDHEFRGEYVICQHRIADRLERMKIEKFEDIKENTQGLIKKDLLKEWGCKGEYSF